MDKVSLLESKRSIHSTRIDVIAGDPMPIKPVDSLPINAIQRPKVEDPEYTPETSSELAAALSALARLVPHAQVMSVYTAIRDMIEKIAPVTHTSLDYVENLNEARKAKLAIRRLSSDDSLENLAGIQQSIDQKIKHLVSVGTQYSLSRAEILKSFIVKVNKAFELLRRAERAHADYSKQPKNRRTLERLRDVQDIADAAQTKLNSLVAEYNNIISVSDSSIEYATAAASKETNAILLKQPRVDNENRQQIVTAFNKRIIELQSSGESFDQEVARSTIKRRTAVESILANREAIVDNDLYKAITHPTGDLSEMRAEILPRKGTGAVDFFLEPRFSPGRVRSHIADKPVHYDPDNPDLDWIESVGYVHVYRRFLQLNDGTEIEIRPDVRIDFGGIKHDFIAAAADDLRGQGVNAAIEEAERFFEQNKTWIIKDALNPARGAYVGDPSSKQRAKLRTPSRAALIVANEKISMLGQLAPDETNPDQEDRRRRLERSASSLAARKRDDDLQAAQSEMQVRRAVQTLFLDSAVDPKADQPNIVKSNVQGHVLRLFTSARDSFGAVANQQTDVMEKRGIPLPSASDSSMGDVQRVAAQVASAVEQAVEIAGRIGDSPNLHSLTTSLGETLAELIQSRTTNAVLSLDRAGRLPGVNVTDAYSVAFDRVRQLRALNQATQRAVGRAVRSGSIRRSKEPVQNLDLDSLQGIARVFGQASQLFANDDSTTIDVSKLLVSTAQEQMSSVMMQGTRNAITSSGQMRISNAARPNDPDKMSGASVAAAGRILAEIQRVFPTAMTLADLAGSSSAKAFQHFGLDVPAGGESDNQFPIFADADLARRFDDVETGESRRKIIPPEVADALLGVPGVAKRMMEHARKMTPESAYLALSADADALAQQVFEDISSDFRSTSVVAILRSLVRIACEAREIVKATPSNEGKGDESAINSYIAKISEIVNLGMQGPVIDTLSLTRGAKTSYAVSVDLSEPGVGYFVDDEIRPVARVVGSPDRFNISDKVKNDYDFSLRFLDPTLMQIYAQTEEKLVDEIVDEIGTPGGAEIAGGKRFRDIVKEEARTQLVSSALKRAAAEVNTRFSSRGVKIDVLEQDEEGTIITPKEKQRRLAEYISKNDRIAEDQSQPRYVRDVAKAASNYALFHERIPSPQIGVEYYTPVREAGVDPVTGQRLLKGNIAYVKSTLPVNAESPALPACPPAINTVFLDSVYHLVDTYVLSEIHDWNGPIRQLRMPTSEDEYKRFNSIQYTVRGAGPAASSMSRPERLVSASNVKGKQVLTVNTRLHPGMPGDQIEQLKEEAREFIIGIMLRMGKAGGYVIVNDENNKLDDLDQKLKEVNPGSKDALEHLRSEATSILEAVDEHINEQLRAYGIEYKTVVTKAPEGEKDAGEAVYVSVTDLQNAAKIKARSAVINRITTQHYQALGYKAPVYVPHDPVTGYVDPPESPKKFFREKMGDMSIISDPLRYVVQASSVYNEYRAMIAKKYGIVTKKKLSEADAINMLANDFPQLYAEVREATRKRTAGESVSISMLKNVAQLEINTSTGEIQGIGKEVSQEQLRGLTAQLHDALKGIEEVLGRSLLGARFNDQVSKARSRLEIFARVAPTGFAPQALVPQFNEIAGTLNSITSQVRDQETDRLVSEADKVFSEDVIRVCKAETGRIAQTIQRFLDIKRKSERGYALTPEEKKVISTTESSDSYRQYVKLGQIMEYVSSDSRPTFSTLSSEFIDRLEEEHDAAIAEIKSAREKAQRVANHAQEHIDEEIKSLARKYAPQISVKTHRRVKPEDLKIVDTIGELEEFKDELEREKKIALIESGVTSEDSMAISIEAYLEGVLGGMIFGVRHSEETTGA